MRDCNRPRVLVLLGLVEWAPGPSAAGSQNQAATPADAASLPARLTDA
jgi:hypothetical protein